MRRALVLTGGGSKGSWQVGACEHLIAERGHWFDVISGVSAGAINGATLAHGHDPGGLRAHLVRLRNWWFGVRGNDNIYRRRRHAALGMVLGKWRGLYDVTPLRDEVLAREIDPPQVAASPIRLRIGYLDLRSRRFRTAGNDHPRLRDALLASSSLPVLFPPTALRESRELGVDGGTRHAELLADTLQALAQFPADGGPLEVWVVRPRAPHKFAPRAMVRRWVKKAFAALSERTVDVSPDVMSGPCPKGKSRVSHALHAHPSVRLRVLQPDHELTGSFLDFDPGKIRAWYEDGLRTAQSGQTVNVEYSCGSV